MYSASFFHRIRFDFLSSQSWRRRERTRSYTATQRSLLQIKHALQYL